MTDTHLAKRTELGAIVLLLAFSAAASIPTLRRNSTTFNLLFSPSDLHSRLAVRTIDLAKEGEHYKVTFENGYPGLHWFAVQAEKPPAAGPRLEAKAHGAGGIRCLARQPGLRASC